MGRGARGGDLSGLPADDAPGDRRRRRARALAGVVDAVRFEEDAGGAEQVRTLARQARVPILFGSDQIDDAAPARADAYYNSAFLVRPDGTTGGVYRKMHLVPFGEYVPLKQAAVLRGAARRGGVAISRAGDEAALLPVGRSPDQHGDLLRSRLSRSGARSSCGGGSELLTTITNDAWFGATSAPYQHFEQASMRAIEEGRYLVRSANTGISGIVDPYGRVLAQTDDLSSRRSSSARRGSCDGDDVYARIGDVVRLRVASIAGAARRCCGCASRRPPARCAQPTDRRSACRPSTS